MTRHIASLVHDSTLTPALSRKRARGQNQPRDQRKVRQIKLSNPSTEEVKNPAQKLAHHISRSREINRHEQREVPNLPLMKPLTRGGCPNGEPSGARSEFCRVTPNSKRFLVTFWRKQKVTRPPGRTPGTRNQPPSRSKKTEAQQSAKE